MINNKLILNDKYTLKDILTLIDKNGDGMLPVVNGEDTLIGIITDGDIRRGIINNKSVEDIINYNPITVDKNISRIEISFILKKIRRRHIPIVDDNGKLVDIFSLDDEELNTNSNNVFILAGGLGTRLGDLTKNTPKPMLNVKEKPILQSQIEMFRNQGFNNFIISVNYKSDVIKNYFKDGNQFGVSVGYVEEEKRLGTAGPILLAKDSLKEPFIVINGDILCTLDFNKILEEHILSDSDATMCIKERAEQIQYGVINCNKDGSIDKIEEKPTNSYFINTGIYVFSPSVLEFIPENEYFDMNILFEKLIDNKNIKTNTFVLNDYWIDIGHKEDYYLANNN